MENRELTRAELEIMQVLWEKENAFVNDVMAVLPEPKPAYNTVSTVIRILEKKGFVGHKSYGRTFQYHPLISKEEYTNGFMYNVLNSFFDGSVTQMVSFFAQKEKISLSEMNKIMEILNTKK